MLFAAVLLKAVACALQEVPELNGFWVDGGFKPSQAVHLGVGIALKGGGLIAPAIHDADRKSVPEMMDALGDLIQRVRSGSVRSSELTDATVTVTNLGEQGVETVYGVIYPPQVALSGSARSWSVPGRTTAGCTCAGCCTRRCARITARASGTAAHCSSPRSIACCRNRRNCDEQGRHPPRLLDALAGVAPEGDYDASRRTVRCAISSTSIPSTFSM